MPVKGVTVSPTKTRVVELPVGRMFVKLDGVSLNRGENRSTGRGDEVQGFFRNLCR